MTKKLNMTMPSTEHYNKVAQLLHWTVAGMILVQYVLAEMAEAAEDTPLQQLALLANHKSLGLTILLLAAVRVGWRMKYPPPALPGTMPAWQQVLSNWTHRALYICLFSLPISGWLMSSASAYSVSWFNLFSLPDFVGPDPALKDTLYLVHEILAVSLIVLAALHISAAVKHLAWDKDGILQRMSSWWSVAAFVAVVGVFLSFLGTPLPHRDKPPENTAKPSGGMQTQEPVSAPDTRPAPSPLPPWQIDYTASYIRFSGDQAGARFQGEWPDWEANIQFDPDHLALGHVVVTVNTGTVDTRDASRDESIVGEEFFNARVFPTATYRAEQFTRGNQDGFVARGELEIKGLRLPVTINFSLNEDTLTGTTRLDRLAFAVGTGDWQDTSWVGQFVDVEVRVVFFRPHK